MKEEIEKLIQVYSQKRDRCLDNAQRSINYDGVYMFLRATYETYDLVIYDLKKLIK